MPKCIHENCMKMAHFNLPTETNALYCSSHKINNMCDIENIAQSLSGDFAKIKYRLTLS